MRNTGAPIKKLAGTVAAVVAIGAALTALAPVEAPAHPRTITVVAQQTTDKAPVCDTNPWTFDTAA